MNRIEIWLDPKTATEDMYDELDELVLAAVPDMMVMRGGEEHGRHERGAYSYMGLSMRFYEVWASVVKAVEANAEMAKNVYFVTCDKALPFGAPEAE